MRCALIASDSRHRLARFFPRSSRPSAASPMVPVTKMRSPGFGGGAPHHRAFRHAAEHGDRDDDRSRRAVGVAAEQRTAVELGVVAQAVGKSRKPVFVDCLRQRERQQKAERGCALGGEVGQIHAQRLAATAPAHRREKMHAADDGVGREHQIAARRRRDEGGVVGQTQRARMRRQRREVARDQTILGRFWSVCHRATHPSAAGRLAVTKRGRIPPRAAGAPADRARH